MRKFGLLAAALLFLTACANPQQFFASDEEIAAVSFQNEQGPYEIKLFTMVNTRTGSGGHSSMLISASERVIFDPAGSFKARGIPERNDVLFGISPAAEQAYVASHARSTHYALIQTVQVTQQQAEIAYRLALESGPVAGAFCAQATSSILSQTPGFESISSTFYPVNLSDQFGRMPGVVTTEYREDGDTASLDEAIAQLN